MRRGCCLFDAFGTLIYSEPDAASVYHEFGRRRGDRRPLETIHQALRAALDEVLGPKVIGRTSPTIEIERWKTVVRSIFGHLPDWPRLFDELWDYFSNPSHWRLFADVEETIGCLQQAGFELGIASNFDARLHSICQGLSALPALNWVFISAELGWRKPSAEFFHVIRDRLDYSPDQLWMVGDDWEFDVQPARDSGWHSIHLDRQQKEPVVHSPDGTIRIGSLTQLPDLLLS